MPERLECEVLQKERYINTLTFTYLPTLISTLLLTYLLTYLLTNLSVLSE